MALAERYLAQRKPQVERLVDITHNRLLSRSTILNQYFPEETIDDFSLLWLKMDQRHTIASVVGFDGDIPTTTTGDFKQAELDLFKIGLAHLFTENDHVLMHEWMVRERGGQNQFANVLRDFIFGKTEDLVMGLKDLKAVLLWKVLTTGKCNYTDPRTKVKTKIEYNTVANHFPAALTGNDLWSAPATANGLQNLKNIHEIFYGTMGVYPDKTVMGRNQMNQLLLQESTKNAWIAHSGSAASGSSLVLDRAMLNDLIARREIAPLEIVDDTYYSENDKGVKTLSRFLPEGYVTFLTGTGDPGMNLTTSETPPENVGPTMGSRCIGPVPSNNMQSGVYTFTEEVSMEPPRDRSVAVATYVPAVWDSRTLAAQKVA